MVEETGSWGGGGSRRGTPGLRRLWRLGLGGHNRRGARGTEGQGGPVCVKEGVRASLEPANSQK